MIESLIFYAFGALVLGLCLVVVLSKNALYAMSALALGMVLVSVFFFLLNAEFLGVVQIVVYGGAIVALYAFGMMLFNLTKDFKQSYKNKTLAIMLSVFVGALLVVICLTFAHSATPLIEPMHQEEPLNNIQTFGVFVFTQYLFAFEMAAILLLLSMVIAIALVMRKNAQSSDDALDTQNLRNGGEQ